MRVLNDTKKYIPEFNDLFNDITLSPKKMDPSGQFFTDVAQIVSLPTRQKVLMCRLTPDMEKQLHFVMFHVKMGNQRRYQQWFAQRYLTPDNETLIIDIIRWICSEVHPPNHIIASNFVPRWAMIGWLLKSIQNEQVLERAKLAVVFDWLFYNPKFDTVMNFGMFLLFELFLILHKFVFRTCNAFNDSQYSKIC